MLLILYVLIRGILLESAVNGQTRYFIHASFLNLSNHTMFVRATLGHRLN